MGPDPTGAPDDPSGSITVPPGTWETVVNLPWVIQALGVIFIVLIAAQAAPGLTGKWSSSIERWTDARRRTRVATQDAAMDAWQDQVAHLAAILTESRRETAAVRRELREHRDESRAYRRRHDTVLGVHAAWDQAMIRRVADLSGQAPMPAPPLWPERPPQDPPGDGHPEGDT